MGRKMYRTHRLEYVGSEVTEQCLRVYVQQQAMQGPAGWVNVGHEQHVLVPLTRIVQEDVTEALDRIVRAKLRTLWTIEQEDGLF